MDYDSFEEKPHDLNALLNLIVEQASGFTKAERTLVYLYDEHEKILWNRAGQGADFMELEFALGHGVVGKVMDTEQIFNIQDAATDGRFESKFDDVIDVKVRNALVAPIVDIRGKKVGVIQQVNKPDGAFNEKDEQFIKSICASAAVAIDNIIIFGHFQQIRKQEQELAEEVKAQNRKLQDAYKEIEEKSKVREESAKKVGSNRTVAIVASVVLIGAIGFGVWKAASFKDQKKETYVAEPLPTLMNAKGEAVPIHTVTTEPVNFSITQRGNLEPSEVINMAAPFTGRVTFFDYTVGMPIKKDQILMKLDTSEIEVEYGKARIDEAQKKEEYEKRQKWSSSKDMANAQRDVEKAAEDIKNVRYAYNKKIKLHDLGVISDNELEDAKKAITVAEEGLVRQKDAYEATAKLGDKNAVDIAKFAYEEAASATRKVKAKMDQAVLRSTIDGVAIVPLNSKGESKIGVGVTIEENTVFASVANMSQLVVAGKVEESDILNVKVGQKVSISGDAFRAALNGRLDYVSSEARPGRSPSFEIRVLTDILTPDQSRQLRLGMSAQLRIITYQNPNAIVVPFDTVKITPEGNFVFRVNPGAKEPERVAVTTGVTTRTGVEITNGIAKDDQILFIIR